MSFSVPSLTPSMKQLSPGIKHAAREPLPDLKLRSNNQSSSLRDFQKDARSATRDIGIVPFGVTHTDWSTVGTNCKFG